MLGWYSVAPFDQVVARRAAQLRRERRWTLPDATIYATAAQLGILLATRNTKDFQPVIPASGFPTRVDAADRQPDLKEGSSAINDVPKNACSRQSCMTGNKAIQADEI